MLDTMTAAKTVGGLCAALLALLLSQWAASSLYHVGSGGHGKEHAASVIFADLEEDTEAEEEEDTAPVDIATLLESADPASGQKVFNKCKACHKAEEQSNGVGPHLVAVIGRAIAGVSGFSYSSAMADTDGVWDIDALSGFIANPKSYLPGTKMSFAGLKKDSDRADLIAYLQTLQN